MNGKANDTARSYFARATACLALTLAACAAPAPTTGGTPIETPEACKEILERGGRC